MLASGRQLDAIELVREILLDEPEDEDAQEVYGWALERLHRRAEGGREARPPECEELARFADRGRLYALRDAMRVLVEERRPELRVPLPASVGDWMEELRAAQGSEAEEALRARARRRRGALRGAVPVRDGACLADGP